MAGASSDRLRRILIVDDDPSLRSLVRTTLPADEFAVEETASAEEAAELARSWRPSLVVLDVALPAMSGLAFCRMLKDDSVFGSPAVLLLTGADTSAEEAYAAGADALVRKPFSPLDLLGLIDRTPQEPAVSDSGAGSAQLLVYARDLSRVVQRERAQRRLLEQAYRQTVTVLVDALEAKDPHTSRHALRVQQYALELTAEADHGLLADPSLAYGFLLHDIGKLAVPDWILTKPGPLDVAERELVRRHPVVGAELLRDVELLQGEGIRVVRSHHERWDGCGYPDALAGDRIPSGARAFAVADALDAITSDRPYRRARSWEAAVDAIAAESGRQFDPHVVAAFLVRQARLREIHEELAPGGRPDNQLASNGRFADAPMRELMIQDRPGHPGRHR